MLKLLVLVIRPGRLHAAIPDLVEHLKRPLSSSLGRDHRNLHTPKAAAAAAATQTKPDRGITSDYKTRLNERLNERLRIIILICASCKRSLAVDRELKMAPICAAGFSQDSFRRDRAMGARGTTANVVVERAKCAIRHTRVWQAENLLNF